MKHFNQRSVCNDTAKKQQAVRMYAKEDKSIGDIAVVFKCNTEVVERMLSAQGQLP